MRKRSTEIIQTILRDKDKVLYAKDFTEKYGITHKTLRNDIKEINQFLRSIPASELVLTEKGEIICGQEFDEVIVKRRLYEMDAYTYKLSTKERQIYTIMILTTSVHYITMQSLAGELYVSRITIVNDIDAIKKIYQKAGAELMVDPGKGMLLKCGNREKAEILTFIFKEIGYKSHSGDFFQHMLLSRMNLSFEFADIFSCMQEYVLTHHMIFAEDVFNEIVLYVFVVFNFCRSVTSLVKSDETQSEIEVMLLHAGAVMNVSITSNMLKGFRQYIQKHHLDSFVETIDEIGLYKIVIKFLHKLEERIYYALIDDQSLIDSLLMHIKHMKNWGDWRVEFPEEYEGYIDYAFLEQAVDEYAPILEGFLGYQLSNNMKKSIVIHICVSIIRNQRYMPKMSVLIVCPGSMATGKYLEAQIKNYFDFQIVDVIAVREVSQKMRQMSEQIDFIISTVTVHTDICPVIKVHPFLKMEDMNLLQKMVFQKQRHVQSTTTQKLSAMKNMIHNIVDDSTLAKILCEKLSDVVEDYQSNTLIRQKKAIGSLLEPDGIQITEEDMSWRQAMYRVAVPLEQAGRLRKEYIEKAIRNVEQYGDYIVVSNGVALAHADKDAGVIKDCLGLLLLRNGVCFAEDSERVHLLFCFATTGEDTHLDILKEIIQIGKQDGKVQKLCALNTRQEIYEELIYGE